MDRRSVLTGFGALAMAGMTLQGLLKGGAAQAAADQRRGGREAFQDSAGGIGQ